MSDWLRRLLVEWRALIARDAPAPLQALTLLQEHLARRTKSEPAPAPQRKEAA